MKMANLLSELRFQDGLVPAVVVEADGQVLTLCYMDRQALERTLTTGKVHVFRRTRGRVMLKGETSGHTEQLKELRVDCEGKSLLLTVEQHVAACHAGYRTCYYRRYLQEGDELEICERRAFDPKQVYGP